MVHEIEDFYGVYLLYCKNPKYMGHTYIGFTVNPNRRINQHNKGKQAGGAKRTSGKGPWDMVLIVHGFPNQISALRFEWAWQNPKTSRRLKHVTGKKKKETVYEFKLRVVSEMLRTGPWNRLALTIRWLKQEYQREFEPTLQPPAHMPFVFGPVQIKKINSPSKSQAVKLKDHELSSSDDEDIPTLPPTQSSSPRCVVCLLRIQTDDNTLRCVASPCTAVSHTSCLAKHFLESETNQLVPVEGSCPRCKSLMLWGDLIRLKKGCYQNLEECDSNDDHWAKNLQFSQI